MTSWPRWATMWAIAVSVYAGCKWLTWRRTPVAHVPFSKHAAYLLAWPGMNAREFLTERAKSPPAPREWMRGIRNLAFGALLFFGVARLMLPVTSYGTGWIGMTGLVLMLHFGTFQLLSCFWRASGVEARALMNEPLRSESLGEFWGKRWNTAFRDLTHRFLYRPLIPLVGAKAGLAGGFLVSGLIHDLVISVPSQGGYGGPTLFFVAQSAGIMIERSTWGQAIRLTRGVRGRVYTLLFLILFAPLLFHPPFVHRIVIPFMQALGAL